MKNKKIVTINWTDTGGSTVKIINDIEKYADGNFDFFHCYQVGKKTKAFSKYRVLSWNLTKIYYLLSRLLGVKYGLGVIPTIGLIRYIKRINPDIVHIHCPNFYTINLYMLVDFLKRHNYQTLITNHAEFFYTGNCAHSFDCMKFQTGCHDCEQVFDTVHKYRVNRTHYEWKKMKKAFTNATMITMVLVSPWQHKRFLLSPITCGLHSRIIKNGVDIGVFHKKNLIELKTPGCFLTDKIKILSVTSRFSDDVKDSKGGWYYIQLAKQMPECTFFVAGENRISNKELLPDNLILLGNIQNQDELANYYNLADLTVLTSQRETYGMACAESMACGTPVVGFCAGGTESIALKEYSKFVKFGDLDELINTVYEWVGKKKDISYLVEKRAREEYSAQRMAGEYINLYDEMIKNRE